MKYKRLIKLDIKRKIYIHISKNILEYTIITILFLIGIVLGTVYIRNIDITQQNEICNYINNFDTSINNGTKINFSNLLKISIRNNLLTVILLGIAGLTVLGMPLLYVIIILKGFSIGYTISSIIGVLGFIKGIKFIFSIFFLQNLIIIPSLIVLAITGVNLYKSIIKKHNRDNIKLEIIKYVIILFISIILNIISSFIETYISTNIFIWIFT